MRTSNGFLATLSLRTFGRVDGGPDRDFAPGGDVHGRDVIRRPSVAARDALEVVARGAVRLVDETARGTRLAGVTRVDQDHHHAGELRFVGDERPQLVEPPVAQRSALSASHGLTALPDALEVFQGDGRVERSRLPLCGTSTATSICRFCKSDLEALNHEPPDPNWDNEQVLAWAKEHKITVFSCTKKNIGG